MKKSILLNQELSSVIAGMGHGDELIVADAGLPIPGATQRIDLALSQYIPGFLDTVRVILSELQIEKAIVAEEMSTVSPEMYQAVVTLMEGVQVEMIPHEGFKMRSRSAVAVVRTGEFTPFANVILVAGVVF